MRYTTYKSPDYVESAYEKPVCRRSAYRKYMIRSILLCSVIMAAVFIVIVLCGRLAITLLSSDGFSGREHSLFSLPFSAARVDPSDVTVPEWVTADLLTVNEYSRPGTPLDTINGVVIHYTGNPGTTAAQNRSYFNNLADTGETYASSHFIIDMDGTVIQCVPLDEIAYCSNNRNDDTISIECCHPDESGAFTAETKESLIRLTSWLAATFHLSEEDIIRHYDVTEKLCPLYYVEHEDAWLTLKQCIFSYTE